MSIMIRRVLHFVLFLNGKHFHRSDQRIVSVEYKYLYHTWVIPQPFKIQRIFLDKNYLHFDVTQLKKS